MAGFGAVARGAAFFGLDLSAKYVTDR